MTNDQFAQKAKVTVLTDPILWGRDLVPEGLRRIARATRDRGLLRGVRSRVSRFRGHAAVTRSLITGLEKMGVDFNYNPISTRGLGEIVVVLAGVRTLKQAIRLKRDGIIKKIYAGPNIVTFASDAGGVISAPEIDLVITPSDWVVGMYLEDAPSLTGRCFAWPAGVDVHYWCPADHGNEKNALIFEKQNNAGEELISRCAEYMRDCGWSVDRIKYGEFTHEQYRDKLRRTSLLVGFSLSESQGVAWAEAWSTDVPTLLWENSAATYRGRGYTCSTAPYLCPENGLFFKDLDDFKEKIFDWESYRRQFHPRAWVLQSMSDEVSASVLYRKITEC